MALVQRYQEERERLSKTVAQNLNIGAIEILVSHYVHTKISMIGALSCN